MTGPRADPTGAAPGEPAAAPRSRPLHRTTRDLALEATLSFATTAAFPHLTHRLRWTTRLGARGLAIYVLARTVMVFSTLQWMAPWARRVTAERDALVARLGREPTPEEMAAHLGLRPPFG